MLIARGLQRLRSRAGLTQTELAKAAGVSVGTVNRYLDWQDRARLRVPTMRSLAVACQATAEEREALELLVRTQQDGWWVGQPGFPSWLDPLLSFESYAEYEHIYANNLVPGLLQTQDYAFALHRAQEPRADSAEIERKVDARLKRQQSTLDRSPALHVWAVLDESVLRRRPSQDDAVMAEQIKHLEELAQRPNVDIQVLPFAAGHSAGSGGHYLILGRDDARDPVDAMGVVYLELHRRGVYLDATEDVQAYKLMFDYARSKAADTTASLRMLAKARQEFE
ncbi:helix-turn-helix domain-containing protein [Streptomyces sp. NPDC094468]|uniref:helix-turn-helix domain-containing protein n=1 Tax=Streptomyces sp. NPDC094468 TaxID=3366066 RepID=UPI003828C803